MERVAKPPRRKSLSSLPMEEKRVEPREVKLEYYSSLLDRKPAQAKCLSDDNLEYSRPTSPALPTTLPLPRKSHLPESELSETESQSSAPSDAISPIQKPRYTPSRESLSNSLESFHEPRGRRLKRPKAVRKASASSTSSYDSRPEPAARRMRKSASCHAKSKEGRRDWREPDPVGDTCRYLLDVLQARTQVTDRGTKSLPRNHKPHSSISRHLSDALRCEKDCLKILKSVSKEKTPVVGEEVRSPGPAYSRRCDSEESYFEGRCSSLPKRTNKTRYPKTAEIKKLRSIATPHVEAPTMRSQTIERVVEVPKKREKKPVEECVLRIEDGNLWIEICKAVQESQSRLRAGRQCCPDPRE